jgi:dolichyl-phosphate beta-glucosyltransferase
MVKYSIIIPLYNESIRIKRLMDKILIYWLLNKYECEILFVDDGSVDYTQDKVKEFISKIEPFEEGTIRLIEAEHSGKWGALRRGFLEAKGEKVFFLDADLSIGLDEIEPVLNYKEMVCIGNRRIHKIHGYSINRTISSEGFSFLVKLLTGLRLQDTQAPFKMFSKDPIIVSAFEKMKETGFIGDVEILMMIKKRKIAIREVPVLYIFNQGNFKVLRNSIKMFFALIRVAVRRNG